MIVLMMVMLMVFFRCGELVLLEVLWGGGPIPRVEYGIKRQNYVTLIRGSVSKVAFEEFIISYANLQNY